MCGFPCRTNESPSEGPSVGDHSLGAPERRVSHSSETVKTWHTFQDFNLLLVRVKQGELLIIILFIHSWQNFENIKISCNIISSVFLFFKKQCVSGICLSRYSHIFKSCA